MSDTLIFGTFFAAIETAKEVRQMDETPTICGTERHHADCCDCCDPAVSTRWTDKAHGTRIHPDRKRFRDT